VDSRGHTIDFLLSARRDAAAAKRFFGKALSQPHTVNQHTITQRMSSFAALRYPSESVSRTKDFDIPGLAGKIPVRLYVPHTEEPLPVAAPVFVYYHGGGFVAGDLESYDTLLRALAQDLPNGYVPTSKSSRLN
jgi:acetyl esterase/lipase